MTRNQRAVLLAVTATSFATPFMGSSVNIALPAIQNELAIDLISLGWVTTSFLLAASMFLVPFGRLADIRGRKALFVTGAAATALASVCCALCRSAGWLIACRALQGTGGAMVFGTGVALLVSASPAGHRGMALGLNAAAVYLGLSSGPLIGGLLTDYFGWRSIFWVMAALAALAAVILHLGADDAPCEARGEAFDLAGSLLYAAALAASMVGLSAISRPGGLALALAGLAGMGLFVRRQLSSESPVLDLSLFAGNVVFAFSNLAALIHYSATFAVSFLLSLYLQNLQGLSAREAGLVLAAQPAMMALFSPYAGRLSDRVEPRIVASVGMAVTCVGLALLLLVGSRTGLGLLAADLALLGLGFALFSSPNTFAVMASVERRDYGVASGTLGTMRLLGQTLSMAVAMLVFSPRPPFLAGMRTSFAVFALLCLGGVFASAARGKVR